MDNPISPVTISSTAICAEDGFSILNAVLRSTFREAFCCEPSFKEECCPPAIGTCQMVISVLEIFFKRTLNLPCLLLPKIKASFALIVVVELSFPNGL